MISKVFSAGLLGIDAYLVEVEVDISPGLAQWNTVGLPESSVRESRDRVISAIKNSGYSFERRRITINLAPADIKKEGTAFDLPIALGLLASSELITLASLQNILFAGELSLHGEINPIHGALPIALLAKEKKLDALFLPEKNVPEARFVEGVPIFGVNHLSQVVKHLTEEERLIPCRPPSESEDMDESPAYAIDFSEIRGQPLAKRALEVAAAGGHNIIMVGPPGSGKTMLAQRLPTILPPMTFEESLITSKIYSVTGLMKGLKKPIRNRPFRAPHHTISPAGLIGGGSHPRPGEVSLSHHGVLFLDELPEFQKNVLEVLRQPLESGTVTISRAMTSITYPARFMLVSAMNLCRCGNLGSNLRECTCTEASRQNYRSRISGPLLDRIDIQIEVPALPIQELMNPKESESSSRIRERVLKARLIQKERFVGMRIFSNSQMTGRHLRKFCALENEGTKILEQAVRRLNLSARAYDRILKVARTIADLGREEKILPHHLAEAVQYRSLDRNWLR